MPQRTTWIMPLLFALMGGAHAAEYHVAPSGCDTNNGFSRTTAFATIQHGVNALLPGDTLTIGPGEYYEAVARADFGSLEAETLIRAEIPGTVLLRGDEPAPEFRAVAGFRFIHAAPFPRPPHAVKEADTLNLLETAPNLAELEFNPGHFYYDEPTRTLYLSTSDLQPPDRHHYTLSTLDGRGGIFFLRGRRVMVDGLAATGFNSRDPLPRLQGGNTISDVIPWGFFLSQCRQSTLRNCTAFLNAGGMAAQSGTYGHDNTIERCQAFGNHSTRGASGGNLIVFNPRNDIIRDSLAYRGANHGIRMHGSSEDPGARFAGNLSWGHAGADFQLKTAQRDLFSHVDRCIAPRKTIVAPNIRNSLVGGGDGGNDPSNICIEQEKQLDWSAEFADPENHDYRLQAASRFRGTGPDGTDRGPFPYAKNIYYVRSDGDDAADGLSVSNAWRTLTRAAANLKPGDTLYLMPGLYVEDLHFTLTGTAAAPISIRGRGTEPAILRGAVTLSDAGHLEFRRLAFEGAVTVSQSTLAGALAFDNCRFTAPEVCLTAARIDGLALTHCEFTGFTQAALALTACTDVDLRGNLFDNQHGPAVAIDELRAVRFSDYNSYRHGAGAWRIHGQETGLAVPSQSHDRYSRIIAPRFAQDAGSVRLLNRQDFCARGPLGKAIGTYRLDDGEAVPLRVAGPLLHSATARTANIEWWASAPEVFEVRWGTTPACENSRLLTPTPAYHPGNPISRFNTFSLHELEPDTTYYVRLRHRDTDYETLTFTTAGNDPQPRTLFVAPDGNDESTGLDRERAWRSISRAAEHARPGDTVLIAGGTYHEFVRIRTTGREGAWITFRAAPGEKVVLDGHAKSLAGAFSLYNKACIRIDGLYFRHFQRVNNQGVIRVNRCTDIEITRCFADGRALGGGPEFITAGATENLLIKNCVMNGGWDGIGAGASPGLRIENNVIIRPSIRPICLSAPAGVSVRNNIITDNLAKKKFSFLVQKNDAIEVSNNCFFLRWPETERSVFGAGGGSLQAYEKEAAIAAPNLTVNPRFAALPETAAAATTNLFPDTLPALITDFPGAFATHPELIRRGIGLQPEAFPP